VCGDRFVCTRSATACATDSDCPQLPPEAIVTDVNGVAVDTLTLRLFGDPDQVTVTAVGSGALATTTVTKVVDPGPPDPVVDAGSDRSGSLGQSGGVVSLILHATASDPEDPYLDFIWNCGNGSGGTGPSVTCTYTTLGDFLATVAVTNDCGRTAVDSLIVEIEP